MNENTQTAHPLGFVFSGNEVSGMLKTGITLEGVICKSFVMREASVSDLLDTELDVDVGKPLNFAAGLLTRQLIRLGDYKGPFTMGILRRMKPSDWRILRTAQTEIDDRGEDGMSGEAPS